jgi:hypothetical protein
MPLEDARPLFAPVIGMVGAIEETLEQWLAQRLCGRRLHIRQRRRQP